MAFEIGETPITQIVEPSEFQPQGFDPGGPLPIELQRAIEAGTFGGTFGLSAEEFEETREQFASGSTPSVGVIEAAPRVQLEVNRVSTLNENVVFDQDRGNLGGLAIVVVLAVLLLGGLGK